MWPSVYHNYSALERILEKLLLRRRGKSITPKKFRLESENQHMASLSRSNSTPHWFELTALSPLHSPPLQQVAELHNVRICNTGEFYRKQKQVLSIVAELTSLASFPFSLPFLDGALSPGFPPSFSMRSAEEIDTCRNKQKSLYLSARLQGAWSSQENGCEKRHIPYLNASPTLEIVLYSEALLASDNGLKRTTSGL